MVERVVIKKELTDIEKKIYEFASLFFACDEDAVAEHLVAAFYSLRDARKTLDGTIHKKTRS